MQICSLLVSRRPNLRRVLRCSLRRNLRVSRARNLARNPVVSRLCNPRGSPLAGLQHGLSVSPPASPLVVRPHSLLTVPREYPRPSQPLFRVGNPHPGRRVNPATSRPGSPIPVHHRILLSNRLCGLRLNLPGVHPAVRHRSLRSVGAHIRSFPCLYNFNCDKYFCIDALFHRYLLVNSRPGSRLRNQQSNH